MEPQKIIWLYNIAPVFRQTPLQDFDAQSLFFLLRRPRFLCGYRYIFLLCSAAYLFYDYSFLLPLRAASGLGILECDSALF